MITTRPPARALNHDPRVATELILGDLLHDFAELRELLAEVLERENWLDAFLLAAGMNQVADDYLHRDAAGLAKVRDSLRSMPGPGAPLAVALGQARRLMLWMRLLSPAERGVAAWVRELAELVLALAGRVAADHSLHALPPWRDLLEHARRLPMELQSEVLRLPSCFRSLDLEPADVDRLTDQFAARWPDRHQALVVLGLRTSGSYLGPLHVAYLRRRGFQTLRLLTFRPGQELRPEEAQDLATAASNGALAIIADDPPSTGGAVVAAASVLERAGFSASQIVLSLPLLGAASELPEPLRQFPAVLLDRRAWAVEERLEPAAIQASLNRMSAGSLRVESVSRRPLRSVGDPRDDPTARRHLRAVFAVNVHDRAGTAGERLIYVKGTGFGYFGRHSLAVAEQLRDYLPTFHGTDGGLLFRDWHPEARRLGPGLSSYDFIAERMAAYTLTRMHVLPAGRDLSSRMVGRQAVWQRVADLLSEPFGRLRLMFRAQLHLIAKRLLLVERASVVDGSMALRQWFEAGGRHHAFKVDYDERAYSNEDIYSYDHVYDLGSAAASLRADIGPAAANALREAFEHASGERIDEERWFLYQLLSARLDRRAVRTSLAKALPGPSPALVELMDAEESALEDIQRAYVRARCLAGVVPPQSGPLCAIDVDGTLETAPLGFTSIGPSGALALRALAAHGYRALLASGRSVDEIRTRCDSYSLAGGVAEYGAVAYIRTRGEVIELLPRAERARLDRLRLQLSRIDGVWIDGRYQRSVRAFQLDRRGFRRGLDPQTISSVIAAADFRKAVVAIPGWSQTDFVAASTNKADGVRVAAARLGAGATGLVLDLAVGDAPPDLPMLRLAHLACAPANSSPELHVPGITLLRGSGQAGLAEAVGRLLGHKPGGCRVCRMPDNGPEARLLLGLMAAYEERGWGRVGRLAGVAWSLRRR